MGGGTAGGLSWSPSWPPSWILPRIRNQVKTVRINIFLRLTCKMTHYFASFYPQTLLLFLKEVEKHPFSLKNGLTSCYL